MFLAYKEMKFNKLKFSLIILLIVLITYLVYFLTALAYGLASSYTNGLDKTKTNYIVLSENANDNIMMSVLTDKEFNLVNGHEAKEKLGLFPAVIFNNNITNKDTKEEVYVFGIENISFFIPGETKALKENEIIVDSKLKSLGYEIGHEIGFSNSEMKLKIVGFTNNSTYQTAPIIYANLQTWKNYRFNQQTTEGYFNAIFIKGEKNNVEGLTFYSLSEFAYKLPGYSAQVLTFSLMIVFLIVIIAFVLGIFIYVLTIQKSSMFGVMKAQGISNLYIGSSVVIQTILIVFIGALIGFILTIISVFALKSKVPLASNYYFYLYTTLAFFMFAVLGGVFSVKSIIKIDPLKAIG
ncbi:Antimicrobial peptide ABC transporter permease [Alteracholeplasma palmae J233]|uniref:Antimicrobial peptide ABC transporter permease n=1 Tax=Alteracholeplasma palmae (strain ATCC 49389 / J233) TaxID=1318466 RepID=U4KKR3_ALTPJ|nr:FtsX-like permease family protein [Alteracholeplasma palmae]CCV64233.1 Antimicrobial peptide ABC transporter permease [Alteracholeplasma palmae J233]